MIFQKLKPPDWRVESGIIKTRKPRKFRLNDTAMRTGLPVTRPVESGIITTRKPPKLIHNDTATITELHITRPVETYIITTLKPSGFAPGSIISRTQESSRQTKGRAILHALKTGDALKRILIFEDVWKRNALLSTESGSHALPRKENLPKIAFTYSGNLRGRKGLRVRSRAEDHDNSIIQLCRFEHGVSHSEYLSSVNMNGFMNVLGTTYLSILSHIWVSSTRYLVAILKTCSNSLLAFAQAS